MCAAEDGEKAKPQHFEDPLQISPSSSLCKYIACYKSLQALLLLNTQLVSYYTADSNLV
jgi:hypothetical protein